MKKYSFLLVAALFLGACASPPKPIVNPTPDNAEVLPQQLLSNELTDGYYRTLLPIVSSPARGLVYNHLGSGQGRRGNSFDIEELELSLMRNSQRFFDPEELYFQEGQQLERGEVSQLLGRQLTSYQQQRIPNRLDWGQNPPGPQTYQDGVETVEVDEGDLIITIGDQLFRSRDVIHLAFLVEQNFIAVDSDGNNQLEGISLGLALSPYQMMDSEVNGTPITVSRRIPDSELLAVGREMANQILGIIRDEIGGQQDRSDLGSVPIMIGLYILESNDTVVPGRMAEVGLASRNSTEIRSWETVRETHLLLHDNRILEYDTDLMDEYNHFYNVIATQYPHFHGIVGTAFFMDGRLHSVEITINVEFLGLAEKLSMHQLVGTLVGEIFSQRYDVTVVLRNSREIYGVVTRQQNQDVFIHRIGW